MKGILYHGSEFIIEKPLFQKGEIHNDYGCGFYCCQNKELAREWAAKRSGHGYVNSYEMRDDRLKIIDLTKPPYDNVLYWVALLMHNRDLQSSLLERCPRELKYLENEWLVDLTGVDVVIGYRADDSYFHFPEAFVRSEITIVSLDTIFKAGDLGKQYVVISQRAFNLLHFKGYEEAFSSSKDDYYRRKSGADKVFKELLDKDRYSKETRLRDLVSDYE